jgi:hypothetical protein
MVILEKFQLVQSRLAADVRDIRQQRELLLEQAESQTTTKLSVEDHEGNNQRPYAIY